ncbi:MAG: deoxynucleoside kinase [Candidatus Hodarchaeales archaeon]
MKPIFWIEGIIGAGKSTITKKLAEALNLRPLLEPVKSNPYLAKFYKDPKRWAFSMQIELLFRRYAMQKLAAYEVTSESQFSGAILDRGLPGDRVFAKLHMMEGNISDMEWQTYLTAYNIMTCSLFPPSLLIFLDVDPRVAIARLEKRDRDAEVGIPIDYLEKLQRGYFDLIAEIESGQSAWSRGIKVLRLSWNVDDQPLTDLILQLRNRFNLPKIKPSQKDLHEFFSIEEEM